MSVLEVGMCSDPLATDRSWFSRITVVHRLRSSEVPVKSSDRLPRQAVFGASTFTVTGSVVLAPSGSVAVLVKSTFNGAVPVVGFAATVTCGRWFSVTPLPTKSTQLTLSRPPVFVLPAGRRTTKNSGPLVVGGLDRVSV